MRILFSFIFLIFSASISFAQEIPDGFQKAKAALQAKDYWAAMNGFKPFLDADKYGNLSNYAAFHLAEAALGANQPPQAIAALQPVFGKTWLYSEEAKYLLAIAYFQNNQSPEALRVIATLKKESLQKEANNATYNYLSKATASFLVANLDEFKANQGYTAALASVLQKQTIMSTSEKDALNQIRSVSSTKPVIAKDEVLDLVVILPFTGSGTGSVSEIGLTDFMFELYQGIEYGVEQLRREGQKVNLLTFDSKRNPDQIQTLLQDPALSQADVIIGPIYPEESDLVSAFAEREQIPFIHPLSNLGERFEQTRYSYLFRPSVPSLAAGILSGLKSQRWGTRVAIGYSGSSRDEKLGLLLETELQKAGFQVSKIQKIDPRSASGFLQGLGVSRGRNPSVDQIILLADDPAIAQPVFSLMESITTSVPVLVMDSWLGFNFANYEMLEFPNFYFISNNTPQFDSESSNSFREGYYEQYLNYPSLNSTLGLELVFWVFANANPLLGYDFRNSLNGKSFQPGKLTWGFNFQNSNNNTYVPVFKLVGGELIPID